MICESHPTLIQLVYDIMLFKMPLEVNKLFNFLNEDDDYIQYFCDFEPQSYFMNLINDLIETYLHDSLILIPIFTLINRIPDEFLPSVSNNSQQLLLLMLQVFSIDENYRRCELYSLILKLFARIIPQDALFLLNEGILDDLYIFEAVNKQIATDIFDKLVEYITTNEVQEFHQSIEELGSFIREFYDDEETINWHRKYPLIINQWHITTIF